jgi:hypothetical protein
VGTPARGGLERRWPRHDEPSYEAIAARYAATPGNLQAPLLLPPAEGGAVSGDARALDREIVIDPRGRIRQAGAEPGPEGAAIVEFRAAAEGSLFVFARGVLRRRYLSPALHLPVCDWLQTCPPNRKLLLLPREHCKTSIVSHALPLHILIQPAARNLYFPGEAGTEQRIILGGESERRAKDHVRVMETACETNTLLRTLWPHAMWESPRRDAKKWNDQEMILPRATEYPDPSVRAVGVDGAVTGAHPTVLIKDDLISLEAANSPTVMQTAIEWHVASRGLINAPSSLEFIIGTRWAVADLYAYILREDPTVEPLVRAMIEDGRPIYPERFSIEREPGKACLEDLQKNFGVLFPLLYMNNATDVQLVDFDARAIRTYELTEDALLFEGDDRDGLLAARARAPEPPAEPDRRGEPLERFDLDRLTARERWLRVRYA